MFKDIRQIIKHTFIYGIGNMATKLIGFVLIPLYTDSKYFSVEEYGLLGVLEGSSQILITIMGLSIYSGLMRWYWDEDYRNRQKSLFFTILLMTLASTLLFAGLLWCLGDSTTFLLLTGKQGELSQDLSYIIKLLIFYSAVSAIVSPSQYLLRLKGKSMQYSLVSIFGLIIALVCTLYFVIVLKRGLAGVYEALAISSFCQLLVLLPFMISNIEMKIDHSGIKQILMYSYPLIFPAIIGGLLSVFDRYALSYMKGLDDAAFYLLGYKIGNTLKVFVVVSVQFALTPLMMQKMNAPGNQRFYSKVLTYLSCGVMFCALGLNLFSPEVISFTAVNPEYMNAVYVVPFITISIFWGMVRDTCLIGLQIKKKTKIISLSIIAITFLNIGLNMLFIPFMGIYGSALATLLAQMFSWMICYYFAQRFYPIPYELLKIGKVLVVGIGLYLLGIITVGLPLWFVLIIKLLLLASYPFILYLWHFYDEVELDHICRIWKKWRNLRMLGANLSNLKF